MIINRIFGKLNKENTIVEVYVKFLDYGTIKIKGFILLILILPTHIL